LKHWQSLSDEDKKKAIPDERLLRVAIQEISFLNIETDNDIKALATNFENENPASIEHATELIKVRVREFGEVDVKRFEDLAQKALTQDPKRHFKVYQAATLLKRLRQIGSSGDQFRAAAKEQFKLAKLFD
jgi:hypothetical protein